MGHAHLLWPEGFQQFGDMQEAGAHVSRQGLQLRFRQRVNLYHPVVHSIAFLLLNAMTAFGPGCTGIVGIRHRAALSI